MKNKGHIHAELMTQYAEDARTHAEPWKLWEFKSEDGEWYDCSHHPYWRVAQEFRRKPKTHIVNGVEIPDLRVTPEHRDAYYLASPTSPELVCWQESDSAKMDMIWVERGLVYQHSEEGKQAAILHSKAMLGIAEK